MSVLDLILLRLDVSHARNVQGARWSGWSCRSGCSRAPAPRTCARRCRRARTCWPSRRDPVSSVWHVVCAILQHTGCRRPATSWWTQASHAHRGASHDPASAARIAVTCDLPFYEQAVRASWRSGCWASASAPVADGSCFWCCRSAGTRSTRRTTSCSSARWTRPTSARTPSA